MQFRSRSQQWYRTFSSANWKEITVKYDNRIDKVLVSRLGISRNLATKLVIANQVRDETAPGRKIKPGTIVSAGTVLQVNETILTSSPAPFAVLSESAGEENWIAVNKPAMQHVHPKLPTDSSTVLNSVYRRYPQILGVGSANDPLSSGVVHRLDYETSGVLLFALSQQTWVFLRHAFQERQIHKKYYAIVHGHPKNEPNLQLSLSVRRHHPTLVVVSYGGYPARMGFRVTRHFRSSFASLIEIDLETGFVHQIRASLNYLGHPVLGDKVYYSEESNALSKKFSIERHLLHAARIDCPAGNIFAESPLSEDFERAMAVMEE